MLGYKKPPSKKTDEQIKLEKQEWLNNAIKKSASLKSLILNNKSGWLEFMALVDEYIEACKKRKAITALDIADSSTIEQLKLLDHEVFILNWMKQVPEQFINKTESAVEAEKKKEA
jgi:hypothetical protein